MNDKIFFKALSVFRDPDKLETLATEKAEKKSIHTMHGFFCLNP